MHMKPHKMQPTQLMKDHLLSITQVLSDINVTKSTQQAAHIFQSTHYYVTDCMPTASHCICNFLWLLRCTSVKTAFLQTTTKKDTKV
jgi:hypothetical protein